MPVTVYGLGTPQNVVPTLQDGGNLEPNTTYYLRIDAVRTVGFYGEWDLRLSHNWGMPSDEINFTTTDTKKSVDINWDDLANADGYKIYMSKESGNYVGASKCFQKFNTELVEVSNYSITNEPGYGVSVYYSRTWLWDNNLPGGVVNEGERLGIRISGTASLQDIEDAVIAAGYADHIYYDGSIFVLRGFIYSRSGDGDTTFSARNKVIYLIEGSFDNNNPSADFSFGDYSTIEQVGSNGCIIYCLGYLNTFTQFSDGSLIFSGCVIKGRISGTGTVAYQHYIFATTSIDYRGATVEDFTAFNLSTDVSISNFIVKNAGVLSARDCTGCSLDTIYAYNTKIQGRQDNVKNVWVYQDPAVCNYSGADLQVSDYSASGIEGNWAITNFYCLRTDNIPCVWFYVPNNACPTIQMKYEVDINVKTKDGIAIQNAPVIFKDKNDNIIFSTTTNVNGDITTQTVIARSGYHDGVTQPAGTQVEWTEYGPFTLIISPSDYVTYQGKVSLIEKIDLNIALQKTFVVKSIHSKASKSVYKEYEIAEISGGVTLSNDLDGVAVVMEIRDASDDSLVTTLLNITYNFLADVEVSYATLNGGTNPTWDTTGNIGNFYFKITLTHVDLEGDTEDEEYFDVRDITKPDTPNNVRINYAPSIPIEIKARRLDPLPDTPILLRVTKL